MLHADVFILGAGPAGATAALNLAARHRVLMVDQVATPARRVGDSLPPAARGLLVDMGLWQDFLRQGHLPCHGNASLWNGTPAEQDFLRDPQGHGWHLDRARFEAWLRAEAAARGAALLAPATVTAVARTAGGAWRLQVESAAGPCEVQATVLVDAGGRAALLSRRLGARRERRDKLVCAWLEGQGATAPGLSHIEATPQGWWYGAALPGQRQVLAFHTDSDLPQAQAMRDTATMLDAARQLNSLGPLVQQVRFAAATPVRLAAAHSAVLSPAAGPGWFAAGDAALSFDPLSAQGLFNALYTGLAAAEACDRSLAGETGACLDYGREVGRIAQAYARHLDLWYGQERRWTEAEFWRRRQGRSPALAAA